MARKLILCDCLGSQRLDAAALSKATGLVCSRVHTALCTREADAAGRAIAGGDVVIACAQERARFAEIAADLGVEPPLCVDIRDRAGWSDSRDSTPKMAALIAEALLPAPPFKTIDVVSDGQCLVIGRAAVAFTAAERLAETLAVTVLVSDDGDLPASRAFEIIRAHLRRAEGTLGNFTLHLDALQLLQPGGRGGFTMTPPRDGAETRCDIILDLSGGTPLFAAAHKRDGYLRADPGDANAVAAAVFSAAQHVGTFEKPFHIALADHLCAHSRAGQTGCTRCLDACPTGAILPAGDHVVVDALICAGCGACAALCPSGAIRYDAPPSGHLLHRLRLLAETYLAAGGSAPRLLVHDTEHGTEMIALAARFGRGLPDDVIPFGVTSLAGMGHAELLAALAMGFCSVDILPAPQSERDLLARELALAVAMSRGAEGATRLRLLDMNDPEALSDSLYAARPAALVVTPVLALGNRRQVARLAAQALNPAAETPLPLPAGAPYGAVLVNTESCTLCLSCAALCPSGALLDNPDKPQLRFQEEACLQCGICVSVCPENAITLVPRFDASDAVLTQRVLNEQEPFACIECGKLFGVKSTVMRIIDQLEGKHPMFRDGAAGRLIQMCNDCRVQAQYHATNNPFAGKERPQVRTTDDYLDKRRDH
ncbi:MAG: 4Fe-4S binding protein [Pseudorhodobacter sp.]|nr:4Fe-4S binding protein [Pseudorhodobacter sp.]